MSEMYKDERPKTVKALVGNEVVKGLLATYAANPEKVPHAILLTGPSGTGKTTVARILCDAVLGIHPADLQELNCADARGIEVVRDIASTMRLAPKQGTARGWVIDEAHMLTKPAQEAFLKVLEDTPNHSYFFLATTDPRALIEAVRTRTTQIGMKALPDASILKYLERMCTKYELEIDDEVLEGIAEVADGSMRKALVLLDQCRHVDPKVRLELVKRGDTKATSIELCRELLKPKPSWASLGKLIKAIDDEPESLRRMILGYMSAVAMANPKNAPRALRVLDCFRDNYYDTGKAGLTISCGALVFND